MYLERNNNCISLKLKPNTNEVQINNIKNQIAEYSKDIRKFSFRKTNGNIFTALMIELKTNLSQNKISLLEQVITNNINIESSGMCFTTGDRVLHFTTDEVIVKFNKNVSEQSIKDLCKIFKTNIEEKISGFENVYLLTIDKSSVDNVFETSNKFAITQFVDFAQPNFIRLNMLLDEGGIKVNRAFWPNDSLAPMMWHIKNTGTNIPFNVQGIPGCDMNMEQAWNITTGNPNVLIAITDTGIDTNHVDLKANLCARDLWYDAYDNDPYPYDEHYHGTGVSGTAVAVGNNYVGTVGVAFTCKVMPVRVFGPYSQGAPTTDLILAKGLNWSWQHGASVINCSWGGGIPVPLISHAIYGAVDFGRNGKGTVVFAGSGNDNDDTLLYPARLPEVMGIGGLSPCNQRKSLTSCDNVDSVQQWGASYGENISVVAPTTFIGTTELGGNWCICGNGTSVASPLACAVGALILSKNINLSGDSVRMIIERTAQKVGNYSYNVINVNGMWNFEMGYGRIDPKAALDMTPQGPQFIFDQTPPLIIFSPPMSSILNTQVSVQALITDNELVAVGSNAPRMYFYTSAAPTIYTVIGNLISANVYQFSIPQTGSGTKVFYYIAAQDTSSNGNITTFPYGGRGVNPPGTISPTRWMFLQNTQVTYLAFNSTDVPVYITSAQETTVVSFLNCTLNKTILDVNCSFSLDHTYLEEITISLVSPSGTEIVLAGGVGSDGDNFTNTTFDDQALISIEDTNYHPPYTGIFRPIENLWFMNAENSYGDWKLKVYDNGAGDGGELISWSINIGYSQNYDANSIPGQFALLNNYPNPFNPQTRIFFNVPYYAKVRLVIYDLLGRQVKVLLDDYRSAKYNDFADYYAEDLASGVYLCSMVADGNFIDARRIVLLK